MTNNTRMKIGPAFARTVLLGIVLGTVTLCSVEAQIASNALEERAPAKVSPTELMDHIIACIRPVLPGALDASGSVLFLVTVDREGSVQEARPLTNMPLLVPFAEKALKQWRFSPLTIGTETVSMQGTVVVSVGWDRHEPNPRCPTIPVRLSSAEIDALVVERQPILRPDSLTEVAIKGSVEVELTVDMNGRVVDVQAVGGDLLVRDAVLASVRRWRFQTHYANDQPARFTGTLDIPFDFSGNR